LAKVSGLTDRKAIAVRYALARNAQGQIYPGYTPGAESIPIRGFSGWSALCRRSPRIARPI